MDSRVGIFVLIALYDVFKMFDYCRIIEVQRWQEGLKRTLF